MLTLMIFRHAKSSWDDPRLDDFDRPLAPRGVNAAKAIAQYMRANVPPPDRIVCSPAQRAKETLALVLPALNAEVQINLDRALYDLGSARALWDHVKALKVQKPRLMLVGHNPLLEQLAALLIGSGDPADRQELAAKYPTAALALIEFEAESWSAVTPASGRLVGFIKPRALASKAS